MIPPRLGRFSQDLIQSLEMGVSVAKLRLVPVVIVAVLLDLHDQHVMGVLESQEEIGVEIFVDHMSP